MQQINSIKSNFEKWLEKHVGAQAGTFRGDKDISIFAYANEFREYVSESYNGQNVSMSLSDLLELEITDGKFVIPYETQEPLSATEGTEQDGQSEDFALLLNNLFADEKFKTAIDINKDGELDNEEIANFLKELSGVDGNSDDVSIQDIVGAMQNAVEGKKIGTPIAQTSQTTESTGVDAPSPSSGGDYNPGSDDSPKEKNLDNMSEAELNSELTTANSTLSTKQSELASAIDGTSPELKGLKENIETAYQTYHDELEKLDKQKADDLNELKVAIDKKQSEINENDKQISQQESTVKNCETDYNNTVKTRETLEASLADLKSADVSKMNAEQKADIEAKINDLENTQIPNAKQKEEAAKAAWDKAKEDLKTLKEKKDELENGENGLKSLKEQMTTLENEINEAYPEISELINAYHEAQDKYESAQKAAVSAAQKGVNEAQEYVSKVQTAIAANRNKELKKDYSANVYNAEEGERLVQTAREMLGIYGSTTGYCASGVSRTIKMAYGISMHGNGCDWDTNMEELTARGLFTEVTSDYPTSDTLSDLPAGAIVCWEATSGSGGGGAQYGHVTIADGNGGEISDHYEENIFRSVGGRNDTYRVFIPV